MTSNGTRVLCGEHGLPLFYAAGSVMCEHEQHPCDLSWSDLRPEAGERIETREGAEIFASEVWVVEDEAARCATAAGEAREEHADDEDWDGVYVCPVVGHGYHSA